MSKRALVVDDSRSSRLFLGKLLSEQQLQVDEAESAEAAIEYLGRHAPDVIFMDHLMPGMDGFQAVQAIKANPRTAQIPILMYTSQEGELYLGQAQALGAAGVVAKGSTEPAQLATVLQALWMKPGMESAIVVEPPAAAPRAQERHVVTSEAAPVMQEDAATMPAGKVAASTVASSDDAWRSEITALREQLTHALSAQRTGVVADLRSLMHEARQAEAVPALRPDEPRHSPLAWMLALVASIAAAVFGTLYWQGDEQRTALRAELADSREAVALLTARLSVPVEPALPAPDQALLAAPGDTTAAESDVVADEAAPAGASGGASAISAAHAATPAAAVNVTAAPAAHTAGE